MRTKKQLEQKIWSFVLDLDLPSAQPHPTTQNCSGNNPEDVHNAVCCQRARGPVLDQNLLPFPMCGFLLNWRNDTATVDATALPKNKPPPTPSTLMGNILNALVTLLAAVWYRGMVFLLRKNNWKRKFGVLSWT